MCAMRHQSARDLVDTLAELCGCIYSSDLRVMKKCTEVLPDALARIAEGEFPLSQWREAVVYLTGRPCLADTEHEARRYILKYCSNKKDDSN